ncbi:MAG: S8 family serine peptidase [Saprospiraceae bacterium]|nr:S8 family serine peptidase [Saprospiraceae bacterium]
MKNKLYLMLLLVATSFSGLSAQKFVYEKDEVALKALLLELQQSDEARNKRVADYLKKHPEVSRDFKKNGNSYRIYDIENNRPVLLSTLNEGSVNSVNADEIRQGGSLGLDITGEGLRIAVWDAGTALRTHVEYQNRLLVTGGSEIDDHACHTIGTILAGGVDPSARGFLPKATGKAYWWNSDLQEMTTEALNEDLLASNHSYTFGSKGWEGGTWTGDQSISTEGDYKFGFYDSRASTVDNIAYSAPYYSIFRAAGNDRNDIGDGSFPADGPFDCINGVGIAKNVFTIGAVSKLTEKYSNPDQIIMSSFSSWGPTDDGRIKPDFVMPGVSIYSVECEDGDLDYGFSNGTSMAAPGALGATMLINEAYSQFNNTYLKSASLKALMVQTAMEAGSNPGPDYSFGWGMINVEEAVEHIIAEDNINAFILEESLLNGQAFEMELNPVGGQKITASIAWTDPAGSPPAPALNPTNLMLVNDLDMRIVDEAGNEVMPWILDPAIPGKAASNGDNFRDNVEKIEFANPQPRRYFLRVTHKGSLTNNKQDFSLVLRYTSEDPGIDNLYWVGGNGNWSDSDHWSLSSGGQASNLTPGPDYKLIFDDNSFPGGEHAVTMDQVYSVAGIVGLTNKNVTFDFGGNQLTTSGTALLASENFTLTNGDLLLRNLGSNVSQILDLNGSNTSSINIILLDENQAIWNVNGGVLRADALAINGGTLFASNTQLQIKDIQVTANASMQVTGTSIENFEQFLLAEGATWLADASSSFFLNKADLDATFQAPALSFQTPLQMDQGKLTLTAPNAQFQAVRMDVANLVITNPLSINDLSIKGGSELKIQSGSIVAVEELDLEASASAMITMIGTSEGPNAVLQVNPRKKFCFDYLDLLDIDLAGNASISIGENSQQTNSNGWFVGACEDLLFANFNVQFACTNGITFFEDLSEGNVAEQIWYVDGQEIGKGANAEFFFPIAGTYEIALEITDGLDNFTSLTQTIEVIESELEPNTIIQNTTQLASLKLGDSYQWYKNYEPIPGATERVYMYQGEAAVYFVLTFVDGCNRISEVLDLLGTAVENLDKNPNPDIRIFPNPVNDMLYIQSKEIFKDPVQVSLSNALGQKVLQTQSSNSQLVSIDIAAMTPGIYILSLSVGDQVFTKKIVKNE